MKDSVSDRRLNRINEGLKVFKDIHIRPSCLPLDFIYTFPVFIIRVGYGMYV